MINDIEQKLTEAILDLYQLEDVEIKLEKPRDPSHGDWASNLALIISKRLSKNPREVAEEVSSWLFEQKLEAVADIQVAGPGFINIRIKDSTILQQLMNFSDITQQVNAGEKIIVEFTDPNPFKEFHIGHLYSNIVGESVAKLLEATGAEVKRADYFGDVGMHVAKAIWGLLRIMEAESTDLKSLSSLDIDERVKVLGRSYAKGATAFKEDEQAKPEIVALNKQVAIAGQELAKELFNQEPNVNFAEIKVETKLDQATVTEIFKTGRKWSLDYFDSIYARLGMKFDYYFPESYTGEIGYKTVQEGLKNGIFEKSEGSVIFSEEKSGLHTRVFVNSLGIPTYEAKELGLAPAKYKEFKYDRSIIITGAEIDEYFKVLLKAMEFTIPELRAKTEHIGHGMVRLPDGKMSSRTGKIIRGKEILDEMHELARQKLETSDREVSPEAAETIAQASIKYAFLKSSIGVDLEFDMEKSVEFEGDSGPYLLYAYVRAGSIFDKVEVDNSVDYSNLELDPKEKELIKMILEYPTIIGYAADRLAPHVLASYLFDLAQSFSSFYADHIIKEAEASRQKLWVDTLQSMRTVLASGLKILGIQVVEQM